MKLDKEEEEDGLELDLSKYGQPPEIMQRMDVVVPAEEQQPEPEEQREAEDDEPWMQPARTQFAVGQRAHFQLEALTKKFLLEGCMFKAQEARNFSIFENQNEP